MFDDLLSYQELAPNCGAEPNEELAYGPTRTNPYLKEDREDCDLDQGDPGAAGATGEDDDLTRALPLDPAILRVTIEHYEPNEMNAPEPVTDKTHDPFRWAIERCKAAKGMARRRCRTDEIERQIDHAIEALELAEAYQGPGRIRAIRGWEGVAK
jgi:hypothetical protein